MLVFDFSWRKWGGWSGGLSIFKTRDQAINSNLLNSQTVIPFELKNRGTILLTENGRKTGLQTKGSHLSQPHRRGCRGWFQVFYCWGKVELLESAAGAGPFSEDSSRWIYQTWQRIEYGPLECFRESWLILRCDSNWNSFLIGRNVMLEAVASLPPPKVVFWSIMAKDLYKFNLREVFCFHG